MVIGRVKFLARRKEFVEGFAIVLIVFLAGMTLDRVWVFHYRFFPTNTLLMGDPATIDEYMLYHAKDMSGRIDWLTGYENELVKIIGVPDNPSIDMIYAKVSAFHQKSRSTAVCRHFSPLFFVMLLHFRLINGVNLKLGFVKSSSGVFSYRTIQGTQFYEPNHIWVEVNGTTYDQTRIILNALDVPKRAYIDWGGQILNNELIIWFTITGSLWIVT